MPTEQELDNEFHQNLTKLLAKNVLRDIKVIAFKHTPFKLAILRTTSLLRIYFLSNKLLKLLSMNDLLLSMACLRLMLEEVGILGQILSICETSQNNGEIDILLNRASAGFYSGRGNKKEIPIEQKPLRVGNALDESEKYIKAKNPELEGIFQETYDFISEYVHPNGPSRFIFFKQERDLANFLLPSTNSDDRSMILNYGSMILNLYEYFLLKLEKLDMLNKIKDSLEPHEVPLAYFSNQL